jgi:hypothetical protein
MLILYVIPFMAIAALIFEDYNDPVKREQREVRARQRAALQSLTNRGDPRG